ncbi:erythromycin esterase-like protein [Salirhabdus euzebyi]|uniref:Erythromycin esterase-like protein n=1 Tax=Salirhabdus euzebyi TaxID=394506 RepID=A0A841Q882_9BACI|nr:erythromycin esterase family protein [Salirhabdus euzebyi]MBB6454497.1 erythromycin esterase-like protein [Salirhabdus euzebyi]
MSQQMFKAIQKHAKPYQSAHDLETILDEVDDAKFVLLGEASHGTSEFYSIRAELTKRLIQEKGFSVIAVEGDWPSCQQINRYVKGYHTEQNGVRDVLQSAFKRWPTWMWANEDIANLIGWLKKFNQEKQVDQKIGFYGIDVYSMWESLEEIMNYLKETEPRGANLALAKKAFNCFEPYNRSVEKYAVSSAFYSKGCVEEVSKLLTSIRTQAMDNADEEENELNMKINALVLKNAEHYYRTMVESDSESWNIRDMHMVETINELRNYFGDESKVIVWAHNTHVGDATATDMKEEGTINVGQIIREQNKEEDVYIVGFGTHHGTVIAAEEWGLNMEKMTVPPAIEGSWEDLLHQAGANNKIVVFNHNNRHLFKETVGHRAIGVVYHPQYESYGNYVPSVIGDRYDAFVYIDETEALQPLTRTHVHL